MASYRALLAAAVLAVGCGHGVASHAQSYHHLKDMHRCCSIPLTPNTSFA